MLKQSKRELFKSRLRIQFLNSDEVGFTKLLLPKVTWEGPAAHPPVPAASWPTAPSESNLLWLQLQLMTATVPRGRSWNPQWETGSEQHISSLPWCKQEKKERKSKREREGKGNRIKERKKKEGRAKKEGREGRREGTLPC